MLTFGKVVRDTITHFGQGHDHSGGHDCQVKSYDGDHDGGHDKGGDDCRKDRFAQYCGPARSQGFYPGGGIPQAQEGLIPGTFVGPTLIFPGVLNPGIPTKLPPANRTAKDNCKRW